MTNRFEEAARREREERDKLGQAIDDAFKAAAEEGIIPKSGELPEEYQSILGQAYSEILKEAANDELPTMDNPLYSDWLIRLIHRAWSRAKNRIQELEAQRPAKATKPQPKKRGRKADPRYTEGYQRAYVNGEDLNEVVKEIVSRWAEQQNPQPDASELADEEKRVRAGIDYQRMKHSDNTENSV